MRSTINTHELIAMLGITKQFFYQLRQGGEIPPADDTLRKPFTWNTQNPALISAIEARNKMWEYNQFINS